MITWILILTLSNGWNATAVTTAPGFQSEAACMAAANAWLQDQQRGFHKHALCARAS